MTPLILSALAAIAVFTVYMAIVNYATRKDTVRERVKRLVPGSGGVDDGYGSSSSGGGGDLIDPDSLFANADRSPLVSLMEGLLLATGSDVKGYMKKNELRFYQAGMQSANGAIAYLFMKRLGFLFFIAIAGLLLSVKAQGLFKLAYVIGAIISAGAGLLGPDLYLSNRKQHRQRVLVRSFPDALDLLLVCVESGLALDGSLARVCRELGRAHPEVTKELNRTRLELTLLNDRTQALQNLAERTDLVPFKSLVAALLQTEKFGTSLTETLRVLSEDYRYTRLMIAENKAARLPVLMTIPLICCLLPSFFLIVMGPAMIRLADTLFK